MMYEKKRYIVHILGDEYTLISDESENHIMSSAKQVDTYMADIFKKVPSANVQRVAVLAALRMASELLHMQTHKQESDSKIEACIQKIEHAYFE